MGGELGKTTKREGPAAHRRLSHGFLSSVGVLVAHRLGHSAVFSRPAGVEGAPPVPGLLTPPEDDPETSRETPPALISSFLPEFPHRKLPGRDHLQVLGFIAKGSYGPIVKVKDVRKDKMYAVKVLPKSSIFKQGALEQTKEEVIIQRQLKHPFIHHLQDCWQTQRHLFLLLRSLWSCRNMPCTNGCTGSLMEEARCHLTRVSVCDYCSSGDLYTCWLLRGFFTEVELRLLAAELSSALGFLHDLGIMHRDVKMENVLLSDQGHLRLSDFGLSLRLKRGGRAFTICGTIEYMAPEVLRGGPYSHAADWWSLGIMLFALGTGEFPLPAEPNHCSMLKKVTDFTYNLPKTFSSALTLLLNELLCKNPMNRLRHLDSLKIQAFFRGSSFDSYILQKTPVDFILELRRHPDWTAKSRRGATSAHFSDFDCDQILRSPSEPSPSVTSDLNSAAEQGCNA